MTYYWYFIQLGALHTAGITYLPVVVLTRNDRNEKSKTRLVGLDEYSGLWIDLILRPTESRRVDSKRGCFLIRFVS
jgi:hypothetical protein